VNFQNYKNLKNKLLRAWLRIAHSDFSDPSRCFHIQVPYSWPPMPFSIELGSSGFRVFPQFDGMARLIDKPHGIWHEVIRQ
jgi:hypothetical protein